MARCVAQSRTHNIAQSRSHNLVNELTNITGGSWINPVYDAAGNMTEAPSPLAPTSKHKLVYDAWNRLAKVSDASDNVIAEYRYNGVNHRTRKYVNQSGTWKITDYYYNPKWQVLEERNSSTTTSPSTAEPAVATTARAQYLWDIRYIDSPVCRWRDADGTGDGDGTLEETIYYATDANMNVTALFNPSGSRLARWTYDSYGQPTRTYGSSDYSNEILYAGYRYDPETGLYHVRHRAYHPDLGRWNQRDPHGTMDTPAVPQIDFDSIASPPYHDGMTLYQYVRSNPAIYLDSFGLTAYQNYKKLNPQEQDVVFWNPIDAWNSYSTKLDAEIAAQNSGLDGIHNGPQDAFRHCVWTCKMAQASNASFALDMSNAHEFNSCSVDETNMDLHNNGTGIGIGKNGGDCVSGCMNALKKGELRVLRQTGYGPVPSGTPLQPSK